MATRQSFYLKAALIALALCGTWINEAPAEITNDEIGKLVKEVFADDQQYIVRSTEIVKEHLRQTKKGEMKYWQVEVKTTLRSSGSEETGTLYVFKLPEGNSFKEGRNGWVVVKDSEDIKYIIEYGNWKAQIKSYDSMARSAGQQAQAAQDMIFQDKKRYTCQYEDIMAVDRNIGYFKDVIFEFETCDGSQYKFTTRHKNGEELYTWQNETNIKQGLTKDRDDKFIGTWAGEGYQFNVHESWSIQIEITEEVLRGSAPGIISYPSLSCSGELVMESSANSELVFREMITSGKQQCVTGGQVRLSLAPNEQMLNYEWYDKGLRQAEGQLKRK